MGTTEGAAEGSADEDSGGATSTGNGDGSSGSDTGGGPSGGSLEPEVACQPAGDACAELEVDAGIYASYRKDYFFSDDQYLEYTDAPVDGGRFQIATIAQATGTVTGVFIDGVDAEVIYQENPEQTPPFEWFHVWPRDAVAGEPIWVNFHSRDPKWDGSSTGQLLVQTDGGAAIDGTFEVQNSDVLLTYVTTSDDRSSLIIHAKNTGSETRTLSSLMVGGADVLAGDIACVPERELAAGDAVVWTVPLCEALELGAAWTVTARFDDESEAVGAGRVMRPRYPIEAWNNSGECPFPSGKVDNYQKMIVEGGIDTIYTHPGICSADRCDCDPVRLVGEEIAQTEGLWTFVTSDMVGNGFSDFASTEGIAAVSTGDESDGEIYHDETGVPNPARKAASSLRSWLRYPELPTFNGGKTNGHIGAFAGMADVQGMDLYIAACAPHITDFGNHPPVRAAYDYLINTRKNHMPLPTWLYAQGLSPAWNENVGDNELHIQPDPQEILVQGISVIAAGAKGFMWFQANQEEADHRPERWEAIRQVNAMVRGVRDRLRVGDVTGLATSGDPVLVEAVRTLDSIVVPVISLETTDGPDDVKCLLILDENAAPHWIFADTSASVSVEVPADLAMQDVFEVTPEGVVDVPEGYSVEGRTVRFDALALSNEMPVRLLVLAADESVRDDVAAAMP